MRSSVAALARIRPTLFVLVGLCAACAGSSAMRVDPSEIPELETRIGAGEDSPELRLRYAAALFAAGRCRDARVQAEEAAALRPDNGVTPLIQGQCLEAEGRVAAAVDVYAAYLRQHPDASGVDAVRGRHVLASRTLALQSAREALDREAELSSAAPTPGVVAVIPLAILGDVDDRWTGLARGLAQMIVSDLSLLGRIRLVERIQIQAVLDELDLAAEGRVDEATAGRLGRLVRAEQLVRGVMEVDGDDVRLGVDLFGPAREGPAVPEVTGDVRGLLGLEKRVALALADRLAGPLTAAEERLILDNGPASVEAFLEWSEGLLQEDRGDFAGAALAYRAASRVDPGFVDARNRAVAAASASTVIGRSPTEVVGLGRVASSAAAQVGQSSLGGALDGATLDVAALGGEVGLGDRPGAALPQAPGATQPTPPLPVDVLLRLLVRIPR